MRGRRAWMGAMITTWGVAFAGPGHAAAPAEADGARAAIERNLDDGASAWSRGDLDAFMAGYERSPATVYVTAAKVVYGFDAIRAMYAARFGAGHALGALSMSLVEVRPLGPDHALCIGRYHLVRADHPAPLTGIYTLVFHRSRAGWKIVADHTSS